MGAGTSGVGPMRIERTKRMAKRKRALLTKTQRRRIEEARKEWDVKLRPLTDAMREASRITEKDLEIRIVPARER